MNHSDLDLHTIFRRLEKHFGPQHWWPADTPFEVLAGAILTQNTAWTNVERAIANLRDAGALIPATLAALPVTELERLIHPAGFFRQKASRLKAVATILVTEYGGDIARWCAGPLDEVRRRLLALSGVGPETADSILLYAAGRPSFVVDAYTRRIFTRLGILAGRESYEQIRSLFLRELPEEATLFNEYHALIVTLAKRHCRKRQPDCLPCPLSDRCYYPRQIHDKTC